MCLCLIKLFISCTNMHACMVTVVIAWVCFRLKNSNPGYYMYTLMNTCIQYMCTCVHVHVWHFFFIRAYYCSAGLLNITTALDLSLYLQQEREYVPWAAAFKWFNILSDRLSLTPIYGKFQVSQVLFATQ